MAKKRHPERREDERPRTRKKKGHKLYAFTVLFLGILIILTGAVVLFYVQEIEIDGNDYCTDREILEAVQNDKYSVNSLYVLGKYMLGRGEKPPCLEEMKVGIRLPWVVTVKVKEKPIVGYFYTADNAYAYFDEDGLIVKITESYMEGALYVEGIDTEGLELYMQIEGDDKAVFGEILEASQELKRYDLLMDKIVCREGRIYMYTGDVCISLGQDVTPEKIAQIPPIIGELKEQSGTLHLETYGEGRETITFDIGEFPE